MIELTALESLPDLLAPLLRVGTPQELKWKDVTVGLSMDWHGRITWQVEAGAYDDIHFAARDLIGGGIVVRTGGDVFDISTQSVALRVITDRE